MNGRTHRRLFRAACALVLGSFAAAVSADELPAPPSPVSTIDAEAAIGQFRLADGFKAALFAAEPKVANPVALTIDDHGRVFVVETFRRRGAVLDMRELPDWLEEDLACKTVDDRLALVRRKLTPSAIEAMRKTSDRVRLLEDRDRDGKADVSTVFSDGYNQVEDGTAAGVLTRNGDVYFTDIPNLWKLRDTNGDGRADVRTSLAHGFGVRFNISGHDMHGLRFGPDGRLYFSVGDRSLHVDQTPDGRTIDNPYSGAVLRCNPDGTELELFATGLRNPQKLAFDEHGNLFTGDNNSDAGDMARWVYVVEGGDSGWRVWYQWHDFPIPRGPWNNERLWDTAAPAPAAYIVPPIADIKISGPAGLTYAGGVGWPDAWSNRFFLVDFRGGPANSGVYALQNQPKGAGFELAEVKPLVTGVLATDCEFGFDGSLYVTDWVEGWEPKGQGRIYRFFDPKTDAASAVAEVRTLMDEGMKARSPEELGRLLHHVDMRVRLAAQFELAERGDEGAKILAEATRDVQHPLARLHGIWGLGQQLRTSKRESSALLQLLNDTDEEVRAQTVKVIGEAWPAVKEGAHEAIVKLLDDPSPRVGFFAALALSHHPSADAIPHVVAMLESNAGADQFLQHAGVMFLASLPTPPEQAVHHSSAAVRVAALLAMRRHADAKIAAFLDDPDPKLVLEAARAISDVPIDAAMPRLAAIIDRKALPEPTLLRAVNANYRLGTPEPVQRLAAFALRDDAPIELRVEALRMLGDWAEPMKRDRVTGAVRPIPKRDDSTAKEEIAALLPQLLKDAPDAVRLAAVLASNSGSSGEALHDLVKDAKQPGGLRAAALTALADRKDREVNALIATALVDTNESIRAAAARLRAKQRGGIAAIKPLLVDPSLRVRQAVFQSLVGVKGNDADDLLAAAMDDLLAGRMPAEVRLDLLSAAANRKGAIAEKLVEYESRRPKDDPLAAYRETLAGGDADKGKFIFMQRADVECMRCHSISHVGGNAGPDLAGVVNRGGREHILESILLPNKKIAQGFETVIVRTKKGATLAGVLKSENDASITLDVPEKGPTTIAKADVKARRGGLSAMPEDIAKSLTKQDLRDLIEYLAAAH